MSYYLFEKTVLTLSWPIIQSNFDIFQGGKKSYSFMLGVNWLPLKTNSPQPTLINGVLLALKVTQIEGNEQKETNATREEVSEKENVAGNILKMCEDAAVESKGLK